MKRILFVDDEPNILQGLRRMLRPMRKEWEMAFASSGEEALTLMDTQGFDVIVSDMRMPGMDGATLLNEVMRRHPETVRFVLSGQSDKETIFRSVGPTHQFLAKPCDPDVLKATVDRAFSLRDLLTNEHLKNLVSQMPSLPTLPETYRKLVEELQAPDSSISSIGKIVESDVGMTAKLLQWVNSAFFGVRQHISSPTQAASLLGLDTLRALVLMVGAFTQFENRRFPKNFSLDIFGQHSLCVGAATQLICKLEKLPEKESSDAFTGGVLHDSGMLVFAANCPRDYQACIEEAIQQKISISEAEEDCFGCTHSAVGAYLLGLWGLPDLVVESVAYHHVPSQCAVQAFSPLTAVHVANVLAHEIQEMSLPKPQLAEGYLKRIGVSERLSVWRDASKSLENG